MATERRVVDNTLPQSAYAWLKYADQPWIDPLGAMAFRTFVDAYINAPTRAVPLPGQTKTGSEGKVEEPFIRLWQHGALPIQNAAKALPLEQLWDDFVFAVATLMPTWSAWTRFQWSPLIVPAYKVRTEGKWPERWEATLPYVRVAQTSLVVSTDHEPIVHLHDQLERDLALLPAIDAEYLTFARLRRVSPATAAIAFAFDWFQRGESYRRQFPGCAITFHDLRGAAVLRPPDSVESASEGLEISWSRVLTAYLAEKIVPRDSKLLCDALEVMRNTVQEDPEYREHLHRWYASIAPRDRQKAMLDTAAHVLRAADLPLQFRDNTNRKLMLDYLQKAAEAGPSFSFIPAPVAFQIVKVGVDAKAAKWIEYDVRQKLFPSTVWKVFRVPGLD